MRNSSGAETPEVSIEMTGTEIYNYDGFDRMTEVQNSSGSRRLNSFVVPKASVQQYHQEKYLVG